jgi:hypothetical protein
MHGPFFRRHLQTQLQQIELQRKNELDRLVKQKTEELFKQRSHHEQVRQLN